jgi:hypothetical protein
MTANKFVLNHREIEIDYTVGETPGLIALTFKDGPIVKSFTSMELTTSKTAFGALVSFSLTSVPPKPGAGSESFGFFLPDLDVETGQVEKFSTVGIDCRVSAAGVPEKTPPVMRSLELHGVGECVCVPLVAPAAT